MNKKIVIDWLLVVILSIIWGSSFILMKKSLIKFSYFEVGAYRLIISLIVLVPFLPSVVKNLKKKHLLPIFTVGIIGTLLPAIFFAKSQLYVKSALAGMLNSLTPIFTLTISVLIFKRSWNNYNLIGVIISLLGTFILLNPTNIYYQNVEYTFLIILATLFYAVSINTIREKLKELRPIEIAAGSSFAASILPCIYIFKSDVGIKINNIIMNFTHFSYLIILGLVCTSVAIILFNKLIKRTNALFASSTTYLIPVFAIIWGLIDCEKIDINELIGISIILIGVYTMNSVQNKI